MTLRGGAVAARQAHNLKVLGSNPSPATFFTKRHPIGCLFLRKPSFLGIRTKDLVVLSPSPECLNLGD